MPKVLSLLLLLFIPVIVSAHSGGTDANGCHTEKKTGEYHCHSPKKTTEKVLPKTTKTKTVKAKTTKPATKTASSSAAASCLIKGNISSSKEKIYHVLGCRSYDATKIDTSAGERWFCTEKEAIGAGWRKALNCP